MNRGANITSKGLVFAGFLLCITPASALTGAEVLDKMTDKEKSGYLAGSIGMAALIANTQEDFDRQNCIMDWYYRGHGPKQLVQALDHFRDREALPVIYALINRTCAE